MSEGKLKRRNHTAKVRAGHLFSIRPRYKKDPTLTYILYPEPPRKYIATPAAKGKEMF